MLTYAGEYLPVDEADAEMALDNNCGPFQGTQYQY
jgi:hypothetical protein